MSYVPDGYLAISDDLQPLLVIRKAFIATGGSPDDVIIFNANAPMAFRIIDAKLYISTSVVLSTAQLRTATGGGGSTIFNAFDTSTTGTISLLNTETTSFLIAQGDSLVFRRSDDGIAGEIILHVVKA